MFIKFMYFWCQVHVAYPTMQRRHPDSVEVLVFSRGLMLLDDVSRFEYLLCAIFGLQEFFN